MTVSTSAFNTTISVYSCYRGHNVDCYNSQCSCLVAGRVWTVTDTNPLHCNSYHESVVTRQSLSGWSTQSPNRRQTDIN